MKTVPFPCGTYILVLQELYGWVEEGDTFISRFIRIFLTASISLKAGGVLMGIVELSGVELPSRMTRAGTPSASIKGKRCGMN